MFEYLLEPVGKLSDYRKAREATGGKTMNNFILDALEPKYKKQGTTGSVFKKERDYFRDVMERTFYELMVCTSLHALDFLIYFLMKYLILRGKYQ